MNDIEYIDNWMFTSFIPVSEAGEVAFNQMAEYTEGTGKVLSIHKQSTIQQLRQAGYKVGKTKRQGGGHSRAGRRYAQGTGDRVRQDNQWLINRLLGETLGAFLLFIF